jgi:hypothetical protein
VIDDVHKLQILLGFNGAAILFASWNYIRGQREKENRPWGTGLLIAMTQGMLESFPNFQIDPWHYVRSHRIHRLSRPKTGNSVSRFYHGHTYGRLAGWGRYPARAVFLGKL